MPEVHKHIGNILEYISKKYIVQEIVTWLLGIIHRPCCKYMGTIFLLCQHGTTNKRPTNITKLTRIPPCNENLSLKSCFFFHPDTVLQEGTVHISAPRQSQLSITGCMQVGPG